jgi:hypothetical protein
LEKLLLLLLLLLLWLLLMLLPIQKLPLLWLKSAATAAAVCRLRANSCGPPTGAAAAAGRMVLSRQALRLLGGSHHTG